MPLDLRPEELIYDWNTAGATAALGTVTLLDETLRDGLQSASVRQPTLAEKLTAIELIDRVGIEHANLGLPCTSPRAFAEALELCRAIAQKRLRVQPVCAGRTLARDVQAIVELSERAGIAVEASIFVGSSTIRAFVEGWDSKFVQGHTGEALDVARRAGLPVTFVAEDTTRSRPEVLRDLFALAIEHGASRLCVCDTVGNVTPEGVTALVRFTRDVISSTGASVGIDWHGHNDRGLGLANALAALAAGADRAHATALGVGERVGNTPMELLILNLTLLGAPRALTHVLEYAAYFAEVLGVPVPDSQPLVGKNAFRTAAGVHAAALLKAESKGGWVAEHVYSSIAASSLGQQQEVCIGRLSGSANARHWLRHRDIEPSDTLVQAILERARQSERVLSDEELLSVVRRAQAPSTLVATSSPAKK